EAQIAQLRLADAAGFGASSRRIGTSSDGWSRVWSSIPWLAGHFQRPAFKDAADAAASSVDRHLSEAVFSVSSHSSGFLVSVKVPGHRATLLLVGGQVLPILSL